MAFLALHSDDELTPDAADAAQQFLASHPGPLSNLDRVLLGFRLGVHLIHGLVRAAR